MVLPAQWNVLVVVKTLIWEVSKRVAEHRVCHLVYQYGCVSGGRKAFRWFRLRVRPLVALMLGGPELVLLRLPRPVRVTELDPLVLQIWFELYKRQ
jgi:hypothetical protein